MVASCISVYQSYRANKRKEQQLGALVVWNWCFWKRRLPKRQDASNLVTVERYWLGSTWSFIVTSTPWVEISEVYRLSAWPLATRVLYSETFRWFTTMHSSATRGNCTGAEQHSSTREWWGKYFTLHLRLILESI